MTLLRRSARLVLALAALGGCANDEGDSETSASSSAGNENAGVTDEAGTTTTNEASTGADASGDGSDMGIPCEPALVPGLCRDYGDRWVECIYDGAIPADGFQEGCACSLELAIDMSNGECVAALLDYYACIIPAECESIATGEACSAKVDVIAGICPSLSPV